MSAPRVSVVVPTCGRPELLLRGLQALVSQTLAPADYEIVVVDDGHAAATSGLLEAIAERLHRGEGPALRTLRTPRPRSGPAAARNAGWRAARADLVAFTDDDTVPAADWLARGLAAMDAAGPATLALAGRVVVPLPPGAPTDHARMTQGLERTAFVTANAFVRRAALVQVGGFDERFTRAWREDSDLQFRLQDAGGGDAAVGRCEDAVVAHPVRPERWGVSLRTQRHAFFEALLAKKHPRRYRTQGALPVPWRFHAIVGLALAAAGLALAGVTGSAVVAGGLAAAGILEFAVRRLAGTAHDAAHVGEMLATSALIPFLSVYWRLRGAWHWKTWFV